jgi:hypothetical protein
MNTFYLQITLCSFLVGLHLAAATVAHNLIKPSAFLEYSNWFVAGGYAAYVFVILVRAARIV